MPFFPSTPESLLPRSDSKNPATTCKGITSNGRPCRRSLAASPRGSAAAEGQGVVAVLSDVDGSHEAAAAFFCWQHKDQAIALAGQAGPSNKTEVLELRKRSSIDTLVERLGVLDVQDGRQERRKKKETTGNGHSLRRDKLPQQWQHVPGPLMTVAEDGFAGTATGAGASSTGSLQQLRRRQRREYHLSFFCCTNQQDVEPVPAARVRLQHAPETVQSSRPTTNIPATASLPRQRAKASSIDSSTMPNIDAATGSRPSQTEALLSLIPPTLPPSTASLLLAELSKPLPPADRGLGYIYIFWHTPVSKTQPAHTPIPNLLTTPEPVGRGRKTSDVLREVSRSGNAQQTILLKIGRANNVQRRLNEWTRQCGDALSLIRYYPYTPSSSSPPSASDPEAGKVRYVNRVERLIHTELGGQRVKRACPGCGKEHREWFEVEASRERLKQVDEVVRRWVGWAQSTV